jgi:uncharacterized protein (TIGR03000 family)
MKRHRFAVRMPGRVSLALLLVVGGPAFANPYDLSLGPYQGGHGWSYNEAYGYGFPFSQLAVPWSAAYPYVLPAWSPRLAGPWNDPYQYYAPMYKHSASVVIPASAGGVLPGPALIDVCVPPNAQVWIDGTPTSQTGPQRVFQSPPLEPGKGYVYIVRARWTEEGRPIEQMQAIHLRSMGRVQARFPTTDAQAPPAPATVQPASRTGG